MSRQGLLVVISGFSGAGKGTLVKLLLQEYSCYALSVSVTTRSPREGEQEGKDYFFRDQETFDRMIREDAFLEYASYVKHSYGTPRAYVEQKLAEGKDVILEIDVQGALQIREKMPDAILLFVTPPDIATLEQRLLGRGTETPEVVASRLHAAAGESAYMSSYDYIMINDDVRECAARMHQTIQSQHLRSGHQKDFIEQIRQELFLREEKEQ